MQSLGFFKTVNYNIKENSQEMTRIINLTVEEKPTGEIMAGAGFGTAVQQRLLVLKKIIIRRGIAVDGKLDLREQALKENFQLIIKILKTQINPYIQIYKL